MSVLRGLLDALGFHLAAVLAPELHGGFTSDGEVIVPTFVWSELIEERATATLRVDGADLGPFIEGAVAEPLIRYALADLAMAVDRPDDTVFYAHRAIESARQYFVALEDLSEASSWERLRQTFALDEATLKALSKASTPRRHGALPPMTSSERVGALRLAREIVAKLVAYHVGEGPATSLEAL